MNTIPEVRQELAEISADLRNANEGTAATKLATLNGTFFTTTTEYLVEALELIDQLEADGVLTRSPPNLRARIGTLKVSARRLANLQ
jgi:hypothetical protein